MIFCFCISDRKHREFSIRSILQRITFPGTLRGSSCYVVCFHANSVVFTPDSLKEFSNLGNDAQKFSASCTAVLNDEANHSGPAHLNKLMKFFRIT